MANLVPASNLQAAAVAGAIVTLIQHFVVSQGGNISPDVANALTALTTVLVAHLWDVVTGENDVPPKP